MIRRDHADSSSGIWPGFVLRIVSMTSHYRHGLGAPAAAYNATVYALVVISAFVVAPLAGFGQDTASEKGIPAQSIATILPRDGDAERRKALAAKGITYELNYIGEWQANVAGGVSPGSIYIGRLEGVIDVDLAKIMG